MRRLLVPLAAVLGLLAALNVVTPSASAQKAFTFTDDARSMDFVTRLDTPNKTNTASTGFYQKTAAYLGKDTTTFQVYGYSATAPIAYAQYDAEKANISGVGAKFTRVELNALLAPADRMPTSAVTLSASDDGKKFTPLAVKVSGPIADGGYNQIYMFSVSSFKPMRFLRFGVTQDPTARDKAGKFYTTAAVGSVTLHGIKHAP